MVRQPAIRAPITADNPTAPAPNTTTVSSGRTASALSTVPTPVCTLQPSGAANAGSRPSSMETAFPCRAMAYVARLDCPKKPPAMG